MVLINNNNIYIPDEMNREIMEYIGDYFPFSVSMMKSGWTRFDFNSAAYEKLRNVREIIPRGVIFKVRDFQKCRDLSITFSDLKFQFEKQPGHRDLERLTGCSWDKLNQMKTVVINGMTNEGLEQPLTNKQSNGWVLPHEIGQLRHLLRFGISESSCVNVPDSIGYMTKLKELWFVDNDCPVHLPVSISNLKQLKKLSWEIDDEYVHSSICKCKKLTELHLYNMGMCELPDLSNIPFLEVLMLTGTEWEKGIPPKWIRKCTELKELCLIEGNMSVLPAFIEKLNLDYLSVRDNFLEFLPKWIFNIHSAHIDVSNNDIEELPATIRLLNPHVNFFNISGNPLRTVPAGIEMAIKSCIFIIGDHTNLCEQDKMLFLN
uniref:Leucine-rich repeat domain-containing protein n=1 Tax=viral metagenome TaxID=1070528 RepID=A0A6C0LT13_9ZZZZ